MRNYHNGPTSDNPSFQELQEYLPSVLKKVAANLECYIERLEDNVIINISEM